MRKLCLILTFSGVLVLPVFSGQWEKLAFPIPGPTALLGTTRGLYGGSLGRIYLSTDNAQSWDSLSRIMTGPEDLIEVGNVLLSRSTLYRSGGGYLDPLPCVFRSRDSGRTWDSLLAGVWGSPSLVMGGSRLYANPDFGLFVSPDTGTTWTRIDSAGTFPGLVAELAAVGSTLYARIWNDTTSVNKLYRSTNGGSAWVEAGTGLPPNFSPIIACGDSVYVATAKAEGFFLSRDRGDSWSRVNAGLPDSSGFRNLLLVGNTLLASIFKDFYQTVYRLDLSDTTWKRFDEGLQLAEMSSISHFTVGGEYIFLGTESGVWRRPLADLATAVPELRGSLPYHVVLFQNYPNPFNPTTTIKYELPKSSIVRLSVYDILGRELSMLVNERKNAGAYQVKFDGAGLPSGVYFYRIQAGDFTRTRKLCRIR